ncbi:MULTISPECIES: CBS domain-containing protein [Marinobacter]|uniref:CBS domain-containing protein n=2 Tax=Marinobacteraceae TaxID=2887365 RepID=UPI0029435840|nr:CBS domain-containing protein [Marinobacter salarius]WOI17315.1 CBS domain-containing protein [Marinobacter salarius]
MGNQSSVQASLSAGARYRLVSQEDEDTLTNDAAASELLKDFTRQAPVIARSSREIQEVKKTLDVSGETFCVVINRNDEVVGIVTLKDLIGSWPMSLANQRGSTIADIVARDIMRPVWRLPTIELGKLQDLKIDELIAIFKGLHSDYLLVMDTVAVGAEEQVICGLLSSDDLSRRLGIRVNPDPGPGSFSDIVHAVRKNPG